MYYKITFSGGRWAWIFEYTCPQTGEVFTDCGTTNRRRVARWEVAGWLRMFRQV
jgi:hypothetical protein